MTKSVVSRIWIFMGILLLFIGTITNVSSIVDMNQVVSEERALVQIASDPEGDVDNTTVIELDLVAAWMGDDEEYIFFVVKYDFMNELQAFVNVTLRTETGDLFLIMAWVSGEFTGLSITHATSLVGNSKNTGEECFFANYESPNRVRRDIANGEISFYIDWLHLGLAHQELALVFWSGLTTYQHFDKMPNQDSATYSPAIADRNVLFTFDSQEVITQQFGSFDYCSTAFKDKQISTVINTESVILTETVTVTDTVTLTEDANNNETTPNVIVPVNLLAVLAPFATWIFYTINRRYFVK